MEKIEGTFDGNGRVNHIEWREKILNVIHEESENMKEETRKTCRDANKKVKKKKKKKMEMEEK